MQPIKKQWWNWNWNRWTFHPKIHMRPPDDDDPQDWWFASTAIPLISAATSPLANVMSIVALAMRWRCNVHFDRSDRLGDPVQTTYGDPGWCIALNAISLVCGLAGNVFLLFNFTRVVRYIVALPVSIVCWVLATATLVSSITAMHIYAPPIPPSQTYSQAYWSAVIASSLYFLLGALLLINLLGYIRGHYPQHFALTDSQRTLILQTTTFVIWLLIGAAVFHRVIDISFADALYFSDVTILTLGFGDIPPTTAAAKALALPYAVMGIIILALVVASVHRSVREVKHNNVVMKHAERRRQAALEHFRSLHNNPQQGKHPSSQGVPPQATATATATPGTEPEDKARFHAMRSIQNNTSHFRRYFNLSLSILSFMVVWTIGAVVFWSIEASQGLSYQEALYFGFCSLLTIGYGDITPRTNAGKPFFVVWSLVAVPTMTTLIAEMGDTVVDGFKRGMDVAGDWTVLPHPGQYRALFRTPQINPPILVHQLAITIQRVTKDATLASPFTSTSTPKQYTYTQWTVFKRLIQSSGAAAWAASTHTNTRASLPPDDRREEFKRKEDAYGLLDWDWIGVESPMMAGRTEPEWVLDRLCESLVRVVDLGRSSVALSGTADADTDADAAVD
ncbi:voltage-gated potassium channel [Aspergillus campestris IBT 28561]|uniref:Voltage-gated potassium channel n=1 Tax=Aspergillus campestris (strain IBT 28561) TaxID=1392248 RepID=A0A2I1CYU6_ASPC2|nr:voltage-gated potassium channel [Aspergillus campestris IBT 28561]PKY02802.1 voltage-gated potassium channel [Aspergillus campestris IBT 28561]